MLPVLSTLEFTMGIWFLVAAAVLGPSVAVMLAVRDRQRLTSRMGNLEDVLRRMRGSEHGGQFDDGTQESLALSRERLVLSWAISATAHLPCVRHC